MKAIAEGNIKCDGYEFCARMMTQLLEKPPGRKYAQAIHQCRILQDKHVILIVVLAKLLFKARNSLTHGVVDEFDATAEVITMANYEEGQRFLISIESLSKLYRLVVGFLCFLMSPR